MKKQNLLLILTIFLFLVLFSQSALIQAQNFGDVNNDGKVNISDMIFMAEYIVGARENIPYEKADLTADNEITIHDLILLAEYIVGQI